MVRGELLGGRFYIDRCLQRSASLDVYRALDSMTSTNVTLRIYPDLSTAGAQHLERVCGQLWQSPHPGIERLVAWGRASGGEAYTAVLVPDGPTLEDALADGLANGDAYHVLRRTLEALAHLHGLGLAHGHLSEVAVVLPRGQASGALLTDTTLVPPGLIASEASQPSVRIAPTHYLSPERIRAGGPPTTADDVFALGCISFHCVLGSRPFRAGHDLGRRLRVLYSEPFAQRDERLPPSVVGTLTRRMLTKDASARITARDALNELTLTQAAPPSVTGRVDLSRDQRPDAGLVLARPPVRTAPSLESEAQIDALVRLVEPLAARVDVLGGGAILVEVPEPAGPGDLQATGRAAMLVQSALPSAAVVVTALHEGEVLALEQLPDLLERTKPGQIALVAGLEQVFRARFEVETAGDGRSLLFEADPSTSQVRVPAPPAPVSQPGYHFDSEVTVTEGHHTMEVVLGEASVQLLSTLDPVAAAQPSALDPLPTVEMDLGPLARSSVRTGLRGLPRGTPQPDSDQDQDLDAEVATLDQDERTTVPRAATRDTAPTDE